MIIVFLFGYRFRMRCRSFSLFFIIAFGCDRSRGIEQGRQKNIVRSYGSSVQIRFKAADQCYSTDAGKQTHGIMQTAQTPVRQLEREHSGTDNG